MSVVSAEGLSNTETSIKCFNEDLLKSKHEKFWDGEVLATASTGEFWEDDPSEKVKRRVNELLRIFHQERGLQVKNLPRDVTEEEIRELLSDFPVHSVQIAAGASGSVSARVTLEDPEMLEEWDRDKVFILRNQRLPVAPERTEMVLCVARLPLNYTEEEFSGLVRSYGEISVCFLMISEKTGDSKGYGFVKYSNKDEALKAKELLNGKQINNCVLCCDWLDTSHVTFASLHSKCLYVDQLPPDFRDMAEFRKVFSTVVNPPYCQIALKNGCPQSWGLIEFNSAEDAENTQVSLNNFKLKGCPLRISYYIPGVHAINLYLTLMNDSENKEKSALLPDPPGPAVFQQFQSLAMRNPVFAQSLQNIILQSAQKRNTLLDAPKQLGNGGGEGRPPLRVEPSFHGVGNMDGLDNALGINLEDQLQFPMDNTQQSFVRNPQMLALMQSLLSKPLTASYNLPIPLIQENLIRPPLQMPNWLGNVLPTQVDTAPFSNCGLRQLHSGLINPQNAQKIIPRKPNVKPETIQKPPILPFPSDTIPPEDGSLKRSFSKAVGETSGREMVGMQPPAAPQLLNNSLINGILSQLQNQVQFSLPNLEVPKGAEKNPIFERDMGVLDRPQYPMKLSPYPTDLSSVNNNMQQTINSLMDNSNIFQSIFGTLAATAQAGKSTPRPPNRGASLLPTPIMPQQIPPHSPQVPPRIPFTGLPARNISSGIHNSFTTTSGYQTPPGRGQPIGPILQGGWFSEPSSPVPMPTISPHQDALDLNATTPQRPRVRTVSSPGWPSFHPGLGSALDMSRETAISSAVTEPPRIPVSSGLTSTLWSPPVANPRNLPGGADVQWNNHSGPSLLGSPPQYAVTPTGQKRKYDRILPSPEPSPEGNYIGQHSQGIGGHYADSYFKRKRN